MNCKTCTRLQNCTYYNRFYNYSETKNDSLLQDDEIEDAFKRPLTWFGRLILYPRRAFIDITKKVTIFYV